MARTHKSQITEVEYARKVSRICELRDKGYSFRMIGLDDQVGMTHKAVMMVIDKVAAAEYAKAGESLEKWRRRELQAIDWQIRELIEAWHASKTAYREESLEKSEEGEGAMPKPDAEPEGVEWKRGGKVKTYARYGDVRIQAELTRLRELRAKLLGLLTEEKMGGEEGMALVYLPVTSADQGIKYNGEGKPLPHRPFGFKEGKIKPTLTADEIPDELLPETEHTHDDEIAGTDSEVRLE
jgi:hypothetical protein